MRIATITFQQNATSQMNNLQADLAKTQNDLATGTRLHSAADDPSAMSQVNALNVQMSASHAVRHQRQLCDLHPAARRAGDVGCDQYVCRALATSPCRRTTPRCLPRSARILPLSSNSSCRT